MRILLLGASGLLGGVLMRHLRARHEVVGACRHRPGEGLVPVDLARLGSLDTLLRSGFDTVIHAAGTVDLTACERDPEAAERVTVGPVRQVLEHPGTRLVLVSSDNVFPGEADHYVESDPPAPLNAYGRVKLTAERLVGSVPGHLVLRLPMLYGASPTSRKFLDRFATDVVPAQVDVVTNPVYLPSLVERFDELCSLDGVVHFGGAETVSRFELMSRVAAGLGLPVRVVEARGREMEGGTLRPRRLVLRSERHDTAGWDLDAGVRHLAGLLAAGAVRP